MAGTLGEAGAAATSPRRRGAGVEPYVPPKFALAGQKLTFRGYFQEGVPESALEHSRKRHLVICYFLEDDTTEVVEPSVRNDGLVHGRFLKRMKLPEITPEALRVGGVVEIFSRHIRLYACDEFTRKFYDGLGSPQPGDEPVDSDAWTKTQEAAFARNDPSSYHGVKSSAITRFIEAARGSTRTASFKKDVKARFLAYEGQVLRFLVQWDDTTNGSNMFGEKYLFWLSYYLATEEADIREAKATASAKKYAGWSTLLRRARLPKSILPHDDRMRSCEDVTGDEDYYHEDDFRVGEVINVYGRPMTICDCDAFTQRWYLENRGIDQQASRVGTEEVAPPRPTIPVPPHTGFGSEEDTLESWKHLIPRKPKSDLAKLRVQGGVVTRKYLARLVGADPINSERVFRINVCVDDGEIAVYEPKVRNSGVLGGVWMKKQRAKNAVTGEYFKPADFAVGRHVVINAHTMAIFEEEAQPEVPVADVDAIIHTLKKKLLDASASLRKMFRKFDTDKSQSISYDEFTSMMQYYSLGLTKYEAITLFKAFEDAPGFMSYENFMRAFDRAEETVNAGREKGVAETSREMQEKYSKDELDAMIVEARTLAKQADYRSEQEQLVGRISRSMKNARTAQAVHDNFRRFDVNKDHMIEKAEFRASMNRVLNLTDKEIDMLMGKFYAPGQEYLNYEEFMSVIHKYADMPMRS